MSVVREKRTALYLVAYDLHEPYLDLENYRQVESALDNLSESKLEIQESVWIVKSTHNLEKLTLGIDNDCPPETSLLVTPLPIRLTFIGKSPSGTIIDTQNWLREEGYDITAVQSPPLQVDLSNSESAPRPTATTIKWRLIKK